MLRKKRIVILLVIFILSISIMQVYGESVDELKNQRNKVIKEIKDAKSQIKGIENQTRTIAEQIDELDRNMDKATVELNQVEEALEKIQENIIKTTEELKEAELNLEEKKETFSKRVRAMYMNGEVGYLELLLNSEDVKDFLSRQDMVKTIAEHDKELIKFMKEQRDIVDEKKAELEAQRASVEVTKNKLESRKKQLNQATREKEALMGRLAEDKISLEKQYDELNQFAKDIESKIVKLQTNTGPYSGGKMAWPVPGYNRISSPFGYRIHPVLNVKKFHTGIDIPGPTGSKVAAAADGTIIHTGWLGGYGKTVMVDHGGGIATLYAHNSSINVSNGQGVKRGDTIAKVGSTGMSTGPHSHFEVRKSGAYQNPVPWVKGN